jgi:hypothetical protein
VPRCGTTACKRIGGVQGPQAAHASHSVAQSAVLSPPFVPHHVDSPHHIFSSVRGHPACRGAAAFVKSAFGNSMQQGAVLQAAPFSAAQRHVLCGKCHGTGKRAHQHPAAHRKAATGAAELCPAQTAPSCVPSRRDALAATVAVGASVVCAGTAREAHAAVADEYEIPVEKQCLECGGGGIVNCAILELQASCFAMWSL